MAAYLNCRVYGPYLRKDGRKHVVVIFPDLKRKTVSYPRFILEESIGRFLKKGEDIHHKDGDFTNNDINNLEAMDHVEHCRKHRPTQSQKVVCVYCGKAFMLYGKQICERRHNAKKEKTGPYCSRSCSGKYGQERQMSAKEETP